MCMYNLHEHVSAWCLLHVWHVHNVYEHVQH